MKDFFAQALLRDLFATALAAADPVRLVPPALPPRPAGMVTVLGAGKASAAMAAAVERAWGPPLRGLVIVPDGYGAPCRYVEVVEAAHPVPDQRGVKAARRILEMARRLGGEDFLLALISGGGSSLMALPAAGLSLADKQAMGRALLASGADISEINTVRRHLSAIKGGRLAAAAHPAPVLALLLSDVPGDDPATIASGPTIGDATTRHQAAATLRRYAIAPPPAVARWLADPRAETPKPGDPRLAAARWRMVGTPKRALRAAAASARRLGLRVLFLGDALAGEASHMARRHALLARALAAGHHPLRPPALILSGGEATVTLGAAGQGGRGGPNTEYALSLALALNGHAGIHALAADTDGADGASGAAGAFIGPRTLARARALGLDPRAMLARHDAATLFAATGDLLRTGPTLTNVNDFRAILVLPPS